MNYARGKSRVFQRLRFFPGLVPCADHEAGIPSRKAIGAGGFGMGACAWNPAEKLRKLNDRITSTISQGSAPLVLSWNSLLCLP